MPAPRRLCGPVVPANDAFKMLEAGRPKATQPARLTFATEPTASVPTPPPEIPDAETTSRLVGQAPAPLAYVKTSVFLRPDQRLWLNAVAARAKLDGIDGISASDVVRLALSQLRERVDRDGEGDEVQNDLIGQLSAQAHEEAIRFPGRKNRGLPQRPS